MNSFSLPLEYYAFSNLFNAIVCAVMGLVVFYKQPRSRTAQFFCAFTLLVSCWALGYFFWLRAVDDLVLASFLVRTLMIAVALMPPVFLNLVCAMSEWHVHRRVHFLNYLLGMFFASIVYTPLFIKDVAPFLVFPAWPIPGPLFHLHLLHFLSVIGYAHVLMYRKAQLSTGYSRNQLRLAFWGFSITFLSGCMNYLPWYRLPIPPVLNPTVSVYIAAVAYSIVRYQFLDIQVVIRKSLIYSCLIACMTATYLVVVLIAERWFHGYVGYRSWPATVVVAFLIAIFFNPLRNRIQTFVDRALFKATPTELAEQRDKLLLEVRKVDQMKAVATLAAGLAHEFKNPLCSIKIFSEYLPQKHHDAQFRNTFFRIVTKEVIKINSLVQRLLDFSKPNESKREWVMLSSLLDETVELLNESLLRHRIRVLASYTEEDVKPHGHARDTLKPTPLMGRYLTPTKDFFHGGVVSVDPIQMRQVFLNLLLNSIDAMKEKGGTLSITTRASDGYVEVAITDSGCGISREHLEHIFDPFFTTKQSGNGLGLSIVRDIVTEHGGTIHFESTVGLGTSCILRFPVRSNSVDKNGASLEAQKEDQAVEAGS